MAARGGGRGAGGRRGAAAVEFAILLPLLALILFGIVQFGVAMYDKSVITSASREAARYAAVFRPDPRPDCDEIYAAAVQPYEQNLVTFSGSRTLARNCFNGATPAASGDVCADPGDVVAVEVVFPYRYFGIPGWVGNVVGPMRLAATTVMRCE